MPMPAGIVPIGIGHDPHDRCDRTFYVHDENLEKLQDDVYWKYDDAYLLEGAIQGAAPTVCFHNLKRAGFTNACCYVTKPKNPPQDGVFLVYFYDGPAGFAGPTVFDWDWRKEDRNSNCRPEGWKHDLGEPLWENLT